MSDLNVKIHNATTGEVIEREMTAEELAQFQADQIKAASKAEAELAAINAKNSLLQKLGITEEEARLLLG